jgi:hypothetical protein
LLNRSSRQALTIRALTEDEVTWAQRIGIEKAIRLSSEHEARAQEWRVERDRFEVDSPDHFRCELNARRYEESAARARKHLGRLRGALRKANAV